MVTSRTMLASTASAHWHTILELRQRSGTNKHLHLCLASLVQMEHRRGLTGFPHPAGHIDTASAVPTNRGSKNFGAFFNDNFYRYFITLAHLLLIRLFFLFEDVSEKSVPRCKGAQVIDWCASGQNREAVDRLASVKIPASFKCYYKTNTNYVGGAKMESILAARGRSDRRQYWQPSRNVEDDARDNRSTGTPG
ncbi:hypothetical protein BC827DRAFT_638803 [Russula dissimulans]|nr:hypothetical protein BC827DRAFT_638803 [Russula dissimulans]